MRISQTLFHAALLGCALTFTALTTTAEAGQPRADWERAMAVWGHHAPQSRQGTAVRAAPSRPAYTFTVIHDFAGLPNDGSNPGAEVTLDKSGNIWGTTDYG